MSRFRMKFAFDRRKTANNTAKYGYLEIYVYDSKGGGKLYLSTGIELLASQFKQGKAERGKVVNHDNVIAKNREIKEAWNSVEAFILSDACKSLEDIKKWKNQDPETYSFMEFIRRRKLDKAKELSAGTVRHHDLLIKRLEEFASIVTYEDVNYNNIVEFDLYLRKLNLSDVTRLSLTQY